MRTIVLGSHGMVGHALMSFLSDAVGTFRNNKNNPVRDRKYEYLDVANTPQTTGFLKEHKPQRVFIASANPHVDGCENTDTDRINIDGVFNVINRCQELGAQVVFFSSSYVFDGTSQTPYKPHDPTSPINRYGRQKELVERKLSESEGLDWLIIRTVGVFGKESSPKNFVAQVRRAVSENKKILVPADQTMNPVWANDLARTTIHLASRYSKNIFHVSGNRCISKYEFAIQVAYKLGCKRPHDLIVGMKTDDMRQIALRPKNGCLDCKGLEALAIPVPSFEKGLTKYLEQQ